MLGGMPESARVVLADRSQHVIRRGHDRAVVFMETAEQGAADRIPRPGQAEEGSPRPGRMDPSP